MRHRHALTGVACLAAFLPVLACGPSPVSTTVQDGGTVANAALGPVDNAYAVLTQGATEKLPSVIRALDAWVAAQPNDGRAIFYSGAMRLWQLDTPTQGLSQAELLAESLTTVSRLERAYELLPSDDRVLGFVGLAHTLIGRTLGDSAMVARGVAELDEDVLRFPAYAHFLRALAAADAQDFPTAVTHMHGVMQACGGGPDASGTYAYPSGPLDPSRRPCNDDGMVPHVYEGFFVTFGDFLLRAGAGADQARAVYQSAMNSPTYAQWPFARELEQRVAQADQRADSGATNALPLWPSSGHVCVGCHQRNP